MNNDTRLASYIKHDMGVRNKRNLYKRFKTHLKNNVSTYDDSEWGEYRDALCNALFVFEYELSVSAGTNQLAIALDFIEQDLKPRVPFIIANQMA